MNKAQWFRNIIIACAVCVIPPVVARADTAAFYGTATITAPANLGTLDLAFTLDVNGISIQHDTSYIMLDKTLLFPAVAQILGKDIGPRVTGTASSTSFNLITDNFTSTVSGKAVTRKVTLDNATVTNDGASIGGTYTETITGLGKDPVTVTGTFILVKPTAQTILVDLKDLDLNNCIDVSEIRAAGANPNAIEFRDISQALHLYYNPTAMLRVCSEQDIKAGLSEFYAAQKK